RARFSYAIIRITIGRPASSVGWTSTSSWSPWLWRRSPSRSSPFASGRTPGGPPRPPRSTRSPRPGCSRACRRRSPTPTRRSGTPRCRHPQRVHAPSVTCGGHRPAITGTRAGRAAAARLLGAFPGGELTCRQALEERPGGRGLAFHRPEPPTRLGCVDGDQLDHRQLATGNDDLLARARLRDEPG